MATEVKEHVIISNNDLLFLLNDLLSNQFKIITSSKQLKGALTGVYNRRLLHFCEQRQQPEAWVDEIQITYNLRDQILVKYLPVKYNSLTISL